MLWLQDHPVHATKLAHLPMAAVLLGLFAWIASGCADEENGVAEFAPSDEETSRVESALAADANGSRAINLYRLYSIPPDLYQSTFQTPYQDAPLATPDGVGAFQFFHGSFGTGAIYSHSYATSQGQAQQTAMVYGAILNAWGRWGWETLLGYPLNQEVDATDAEPDAPCRSQGGVRQQVFGYVGWSDATGGLPRAARVLLCWSPERDVWALPEGVAQGLRGEHVLYQVRP